MTDSIDYMLYQSLPDGTSEQLEQGSIGSFAFQSLVASVRGYDNLHIAVVNENNGAWTPLDPV